MPSIEINDVTDLNPDYHKVSANSFMKSAPSSFVVCTFPIAYLITSHADFSFSSTAVYNYSKNTIEHSYLPSCVFIK